MANMRGTNFKSISLTRNIKSEDLLDVIIYVGTVKMATFSCPLSVVSDIIKVNV